MNFITVEDVNSTLLKYRYVPAWYKIDTSVLTDEEFEGVIFDFCEITKTKINEDEYKYQVYFTGNILVTGHFYALDNNGDYISNYRTYQQGSYFECITTSESIQIFTLLSNDANMHSNYSQMVGVVVDYISPFKLFETYTNQTIKIHLKPVTNDFHVDNIGVNVNDNYYISDSEGVVTITDNFSDVDSLEIVIPQQATAQEVTYNYSLKKINPIPIVVLNDVSLINGEINNIPYHENIETTDFTIDCKYPVSIDAENNYINVDLRDKQDNKKIHLKVTVGDLVNDYTFNTEFRIVENITDFNNAISNGVEVIELGANISLNENININHDLLIKGDEHYINMGEYHIFANGNLRVENVTFQNGDWVIKQSRDTKLVIHDCKFKMIGGYTENSEELGVCIRCDIDINSLDNPTDFNTEIYNTVFEDCYQTILSGGELVIDGCSVKHNRRYTGSAVYGQFVYITDGNAEIKNCNFDLDYSNMPSTVNYDIWFKPCIVVVGDNALLNGAGKSDLMDNNSLPFFDIPFNNVCNIDITYKHSVIDDYIRLSNDLNNRACCHAVTNEDFVFKNNVKIERSG